MTKSLGLKLCIFLAGILLALVAVFLVKSFMSHDDAYALPFEMTHWPYPFDDHPINVFIENIEVHDRRAITYTVTNASSDRYYIQRIRRGFKLIDSEWYVLDFRVTDISDFLYYLPRYDSVDRRFGLYRWVYIDGDYAPVSIPLPDGLYRFEKQLHTLPWPHSLDDGTVGFDYTWLPLIFEITSDP